MADKTSKPPRRSADAAQAEGKERTDSSQEERSEFQRQLYTNLLGGSKSTPTKVRLGLASPEQIKQWSSGEVRKPETINYRTFKPERDGLFCSVIFGPEKDYECQCGKYNSMRSKGIQCDKCGVEVTRSWVRRERMGHIELACPVAHIWFVKSLPSRIGLLLDIMLRDIERILYFDAYVVINAGSKYSQIISGVGFAGDESLKPGRLLTDAEAAELRTQHNENVLLIEPFREGMLFSPEHNEQVTAAADPEIETGIGAEGLRDMLARIDLDAEAEKLREELAKSDSEARRKKVTRRLRVVEQFRNNNARPEWMIMEHLPVLPPGLRPLVRIDGERFTSSDLNELYRRIINRNNRLRRLQELRAPAIIINNEKRMLQESVDSLIDNGRRGRAAVAQNKRQLKSLADIVKGKTGRFRQNLLGKRVDFSGRSVIVVGPELKLHQCGLPKKMALELFRPFVYNLLIARGYAENIRQAKRMVEDDHVQVWNCLEEAIRQHPVLLNRAPTLHRLGIQAFEPLLIEGKAIQLHPLVCVAFNADFDGDQMAVHVPLSIEAQSEARVLMLSSNNIMSSANGEPVILPTQDIVLGLYYLTRAAVGKRGEGRAFADPDDVRIAYECGSVDLHAQVKVRITPRYVGEMGAVVHGSPELVDTTVGRALLAQVLPPGVPFSACNKTLAKSDLINLFRDCLKLCDRRSVVIFADNLMRLGFRHSTRAGISISLSDMGIPERKGELVKKAMAEAAQVQKEYDDGILSEDERYNKIVDLWDSTGNAVTQELMASLAEEDAMTEKDGKLVPVLDEQGNRVRQPSFNSIYMMADSGARGSQTQIKQLAGMRGLMAKPDGRIIETPITANFREGLNILQYFISTHGARKGLADTALKTANSGYMTRKLVDVTQHLVIDRDDCGTSEGITLEPVITGGEIAVTLGARTLGRVAAAPAYDPRSGSKLFDAGTAIDETMAAVIDEHMLDSLKVYSPVTCESPRGICQKCYGRDLGRGGVVQIGEAVGVIAAQSIGEPGTQLTMRTFHIGGAAMRASSEREIRNRLPGKIKLSGVRTVENRNRETVVVSNQGEVAVLDEFDRYRERYRLQYGSILHATDGAQTEAQTVIATQDPLAMPLVSEHEGTVRYENIREDSLIDTTDESTGRVTRQLVESPSAKRSGKKQQMPQLSLCDRAGKEIRAGNVPVRFTLQYGSTLTVKDSEQVKVGDIIAKSPKLIRSSDITGGLPRVAELFEVRQPKFSGVMASADGVVQFAGIVRNKERWLVVGDGYIESDDIHPAPAGAQIRRETETTVKKGEVLFSWPGQKARETGVLEHESGSATIAIVGKDGQRHEYPLPAGAQVVKKSGSKITRNSELFRFDGQKARGGGKIEVRTAEGGGSEIVIRHRVRREHEHLVPLGAARLVHDGDRVKRGDMLFDGPPDPRDILRHRGREALAQHIIDKVQEVYRLQGVAINDKHIEVIIHQMLQRCEIVDPGVSKYIPGDTIQRAQLLEENARIAAEYSNLAKEEAEEKKIKADELLLGITKASLQTDSVISAASFQETTRILTEAALKGEEDPLAGLKENVIVGQLIPAGTGLMQRRQQLFESQRLRRQQPPRDEDQQEEQEQEADASSGQPGGGSEAPQAAPEPVKAASSAEQQG